MSSNFEKERLEAIARVILSDSFQPDEVEIIMNPIPKDMLPEALHANLHMLGERKTKALSEARRVLEYLFPEDQADYKVLFDTCARARDEVGFIGTVPQCIAWQEDSIQQLRKLLHLFASYVERSATRWTTSGHMNHPIWKAVRDEIAPFGKIQEGSIEDKFIAPANRATMDDIARDVRLNELDDEIPF